MNRMRILTAIVALQGVFIVGQLSGRGQGTPAVAQIPDAGGQRAQIVEELRALNGKMDKLLGLLEGGKVQVRVVPPDDRK